MKIKTQIAVIALGLAASTSLVWSADRPMRETTPTIVGVWKDTRHGVDCNDPNQVLSSFPAIVTFHADGTMTADTGGGDSYTNEYGSWQREPGTQNYSFRDQWDGFDENGAFVYYGVITATIHLTDANSQSYSATIELFDTDGNLFFTACGRGSATRFQ
jgi:hypothetical protein